MPDGVCGWCRDIDQLHEYCGYCPSCCECHKEFVKDPDVPDLQDDEEGEIV